MKKKVKNSGSAGLAGTGIAEENASSGISRRDPSEKKPPFDRGRGVMTARISMRISRRRLYS